MRGKYFALILILLFAAVILLINLKFWPGIWYDEGLHLQVPKNIVQLGQYGINSSEGFRAFDPLVTTGPTVALPIAFVFKVFGIELFWARLVIVLFALLLIASYFLLADQLFDTYTAITATILLVVISASVEDISGSFLGLSRMVMGEIPAIFFVIFGSIWLRGLMKAKMGNIVLAGILLGLAFVTKPQQILVIVALVIIWVIDRIWYHKIKWYQAFVPVGIALGFGVIWYIFQTILTGSDAANQLGVADRIGAQLTILSPRQIIRSLRVLLASGALIWGIPGLVYGIYLSKKRDLIGVGRGFLLIYALLWLSWYIFGSIGWLRYAFPGLVIINIFTARLMVDLSDRYLIFRWLFNPAQRAGIDSQRLMISLSVTIALVLMVFVPLQIQMKDILVAKDLSPFLFSEYIEENIDPNATIESSEPEIVFLSDHTFHQPQLGIQDAAIRFVQFGESYPPDFYPLANYDPQYLIIGPFSIWTELYTAGVGLQDFEPVTSIGGYTLYKNQN